MTYFSKLQLVLSGLGWGCEMVGDGICLKWWGLKTKALADMIEKLLVTIQLNNIDNIKHDNKK